MTKPAPAPNAEQFQTNAEQCQTDAAQLHTNAEPFHANAEQFAAPVRPPGPGACHCPCDVHPEFPGTCGGRAEPGFSGVLNSPTGDSRPVPMCRNCHDIRMGLAPQRGSSLAAVTDTCTCHCQANHPDRPGICEAASENGVLIDGRPACPACEDAGRG
ncbi:hypothetical protein ACWGII_10215 [Streptomyces sp. NPDC054855]